MTTYGVCSSPEEQCALSFNGPDVDKLFELLRVIEQRSLEGRNPDELVPQLKRFARLFQASETCSQCGQLLSSTTQPTAGLQQESVEYERTVRLNRLLDSVTTLQNLAILNF